MIMNFWIAYKVGNFFLSDYRLVKEDSALWSLTVITIQIIPYALCDYWLYFVEMLICLGAC